MSYEDWLSDVKKNRWTAGYKAPSPPGHPLSQSEYRQAASAALEELKRDGVNLVAVGNNLESLEKAPTSWLYNPTADYHQQPGGHPPTDETVRHRVAAIRTLDAKMKEAAAKKKEAQAADDAKHNRVRNVPAYRNDLVRAHGGRVVRQGNEYHAEFPSAAKRESYLAAAAEADKTHAQDAEQRAKQPATQAQLDYLRLLGIDVDRGIRDHGGISRGLASMAIDLHKRGEGVGSAGLFYVGGHN